MELGTVVAGVDASAEGYWAAAVAWRIAQLADARCVLVHAVPEVLFSPEYISSGADFEGVGQQILEGARLQLLDDLRGNAPEAAIGSLTVRFGRAGRVIAAVADELQAGLVVLGGKHHTAIGRWIGGHAARDTVRLSHHPVLVATESCARLRRVLVALDVSEAALPLLRAALGLADVLGAEVRLLHAVEPLAVPLEIATLVDVAGASEGEVQLLERILQAVPGASELPRALPRAPAELAIEAEVRDWGADLVAVASHGRSRLDRLLLGSVTERLLNRLPTSLLIVPTAGETG